MYQVEINIKYLNLQSLGTVKIPSLSQRQAIEYFLLILNHEIWKEPMFYST